MNSDNKKKVLILDNDLIHYRIPIYNILAEKYDLTHACCYPKLIVDETNFKRIELTPYKIGPFELQKNNIFKLCQQFDAVICYGDVHYLQYAFAAWHKRRKYKIAFWGVGVRASYNHHFDSHSKWEPLINVIRKKADAQIFYTDYPINSYVKNGFVRESLFVAPNTVAVEPFNEEAKRENLLFVGTLYKEKGIAFLLDAYKEAYSINNSLPNLDIIGAGPDFEYVKNWIFTNHLVGKIILHGAVYDRTEKAHFFEKSIACISPLQAGLSVLESQGYGTTFVTVKDAITGGEILNIENEDTGILLDNIHQLKDTLLDIAGNKEKYLTIGKAARKHYIEYRKPSDMAQGFIDAIDYMFKK